jgi:hypothetical protein
MARIGGGGARPGDRQPLDPATGSGVLARRGLHMTQFDVR